MTHSYSITILIAVLVVLCGLSSASAQSLSAACAAAQCNNIFTVPVGTASTQTLVCNSNCSSSGTWVLAKQINRNGQIGIGSAIPQAQLDVNGGMRIGPATGAASACSSSTGGELAYSSQKIDFCNPLTTPPTWQVLKTTAAATSSCPSKSSGTYTSAGVVTSNFPAGCSSAFCVANGCSVIFYGWGGGGGSGKNLTGNDVSDAGGGGGAAFIQIGTNMTGSPVTYYLVVGGGGKGAGTLNPATGGTSYANYGGGSGEGTYSAGGGGATLICTDGSCTSIEIVAGGGGGGGLGNNGYGISGGAGGAAPSVDLNSFSLGVTSTTSSRGGGGGGFLGGCSYNSTYCASGTPESEAWGGSNFVAGGGGKFAGSGFLPGDASLRTSLGVGSSGQGGAGALSGNGSDGQDGAIYYSIY